MRRRELTEKQKRASAERKEKLRALVKKLGAMPEAERNALAAQCAGVMTCEGHSLSLHNQCMVAMQSPFATVIGGFNQWRKTGRTVTSGQHGFVIWAPVRESENPRVDTDLQPPSNGDATDVSKARRRFILVTMFDVSQTAELGASESEAA